MNWREREREREDLNLIWGMENFEGKWFVFVKIVNQIQNFRWSGEWKIKKGGITLYPFVVCSKFNLSTHDFIFDTLPIYVSLHYTILLPTSYSAVTLTSFLLKTQPTKDQTRLSKKNTLPHLQCSPDDDLEATTRLSWEIGLRPSWGLIVQLHQGIIRQSLSSSPSNSIFDLWVSIHLLIFGEFLTFESCKWTQNSPESDKPINICTFLLCCSHQSPRKAIQGKYPILPPKGLQFTLP